MSRKEKIYYLNECSFGDKQNINKAAQIYWEKILDGVDKSLFQKAYGRTFEEIVFSDANGNLINADSLSRLKTIERIFGQKEQAYLNEKIKEYSSMYFFEFYERIIKLSVYLLRQKNKNISDAVLNSFCDAVLEKTGSVSLRVLIQELHVSKNAGALSGNAQEQYSQYCSLFLSDRKYIEKLFEIYPVMKRSVFEAILISVDRYQEFLERYKIDKSLIQNKLFSPDQDMNIVSLKSNTSDSHNRGETVFLVELNDNRRFVYKARSLSAEILLNEACRFFEAGLYLDLKKIKIIDCGSYGWEEYVHVGTCESRAELIQYYKRFGAMMFICYVLNISDLHEENIVASGAYPVIIDAETIMGNRITINSPNAQEKIYGLISDSVVSTGLLPKPKFTTSDNIGIDMSAIGGHEEKYPFKIPYVINEFTSDMRLGYHNPTKSEKNNLAKLKGTISSPQKYLNEIMAGFSACYIYAMNMKSELLNLVDRHKNLYSRFIAEDTQRYGMTLHLSYHPDFMQNGVYRELFLCTLYKRVHRNKPIELVQSEIQDMLQLDIPYFKVKATDTVLKNGAGEDLINYFHQSGMSLVCKKINSLDHLGLQQQQQFINVTLNQSIDGTSSRKQSCFTFRNKDNCVTNFTENIKMTVFEIANLFKQKAIWGTDDKDVNWMSVFPVGTNENFIFDIRPLSVYLYDGLSGVAIFFAALQRLFPTYNSSIVLESIAATLFQYTDDFTTTFNPFLPSGLFSGEGGVVYTYVILYVLTKEKIYLEYAQKHCEILKKLVKQDKKYDLVYGNSGALLSILALYEVSNDTKYLDEANRIGMLLLKSQKETGEWICDQQPLAGMSHGMAGITYSLSKLWHYNNSHKLLDAVIKGIDFENKLFDREHKNWKDERIFEGNKISDKGGYTVAWCHGAPGIVMARLRMYELLKDASIKEKILEDIENGVQTILHEGKLTNSCLCHGNMGNSEILKEYENVFKNKLTTEIKRFRKNAIVEVLKDSDFGISPLHGFQSFGFMNGIAGAGYSLMREVDESLPCIIAVDT